MSLAHVLNQFITNRLHETVFRVLYMIIFRHTYQNFLYVIFAAWLLKFTIWWHYDIAYLVMVYSDFGYVLTFSGL